MASGDLLRKLFQSYKRRDDQAFAQIAKEIVAEERAKHHHLLADELAGILEGPVYHNGRRSPSAGSRQLEELPRDRERDTVLLEIRQPRRGLADIILNEENQREIDGILREYLRSDILRTHNLRPRSRLLFCGPPGCGKTLCAEVIATELQLPLLYTRFDSVISSYLGETSANLRKVFDYASRGSWVLFFDEFDAIGKSRDNEDEHGELKRVVNTFLQILDSFDSDTLVIAATNHEALLDVALWRRFDEILFFEPPTSDQVLPLLELKLGSIRHRDVDLSLFVPKLAGLTHADIERICIDAMKACLLSGERALSAQALNKAIQRHKRRLTIASTARGKSASADIGE